MDLQHTEELSAVARGPAHSVSGLVDLTSTTRCLVALQAVTSQPYHGDLPAATHRTVGIAVTFSHSIATPFKLINHRIEVFSATSCADAVVRPSHSRRTVVARITHYQTSRSRCPRRHGPLHHSSCAHRAVQSQHTRSTSRRATEPQERDCWARAKEGPRGYTWSHQAAGRLTSERGEERRQKAKSAPKWTWIGLVHREQAELVGMDDRGRVEVPSDARRGQSCER